VALAVGLKEVVWVDCARRSGDSFFDMGMVELEIFHDDAVMNWAIVGPSCC